jgi:hypothetical protein
MAPVMRRLFVRILIIAVLSLAVASWTSAQGLVPDLSGTWILQADASTARTRRAINGISIATRLVIRQSSSAVTAETNTGTASAVVLTTFPLDGAAHPIPGPLGWDTRAKSAWAAGRLSIEITRTVQGPEGELRFDIKEVYAVAGDTLTLERSLGKTVQTLTYTRG